MEKNEIKLEFLKEESLEVKELEGRVYFETLPLETLSFDWPKPRPLPRPSAVLGVRG